MMGVDIEDGVDMYEGERFVRGVYPQLAIKRWWADRLGVYDTSVETENCRGNFLGPVHYENGRYDYKKTWDAIRKNIEDEMMFQLEGRSQVIPRPLLRIPAKKAPNK